MTTMATSQPMRQGPSTFHASDTKPGHGMDEFLSPAEAQFAFEDSNKSMHRQTYDHLVGKRDTPFSSPNVAEARFDGSHIDRSESKTPAQMYEDHFERRHRTQHGPREQLPGPTLVIASLRTNIIVRFWV